VTEVTALAIDFVDYYTREIRRPPMKTLLTGVAFAVAIFFTSQAFAMPYCPNGGTWKDGHFVRVDMDDNS
jgi:hypothetical protein